ncbi:MAG: tetratricopeptide repeat protein [Acidobacteriota bacterium]|nr:tetratricopeptide repeat protein [Acidobacteriota bacterium]
MSEFSWWPGLIVLAFGLAAGLLLMRRLRQSAGRAKTDQSARDMDLKIQDLESRRDDLYERLRDEGESLTESDKRQLELSAARTLRDLDVLSAARPQSRPRKGGKKEARVASTPEAGKSPQGFSSRRPLVAGFLLGGAMVVVVGILIYWAVRDTGIASTSVVASDPAHPDSVTLSAEAQTELGSLEAQLERDPSDVMARKRLALLLLTNEQFVPAFQQAQTLLETDPQDIDGLYVQAVVRLQMGQAEPALQLFDQVLELFPDHVQALAWKGIVLYQTGDISGAIGSWERGIQAAGGQHPELEQMVTAALEEEAGLSVAPGEVEPEPMPSPGTATDMPAAVDGSEFSVRVDLSAGTVAPPGILFIALRAGGGGPPVAVRRIDRPTFPMDLILTAEDSMMGGELPERGVVSIRLDQDGDVSGSSPGDLSAEAEAVAGEAVALVLEP